MRYIVSDFLLMLMHSQYSCFFVHGLHEHPTIRMENLLSMEFPPLATHPQFSLEHFLDVLDLPSVQGVRLTNYPGRVDTVLKTLVLRSHSSLKRLEFSSAFVNFASADLTSVLKLTPQLTDLEILLSYVDLYDLTINSTQPIVVPLLENLVLNVDKHDIEDGFGIKMDELVSYRCECKNEISEEYVNIDEKKDVKIK